MVPSSGYHLSDMAVAAMKLRAGSDYRWEREEVVNEVGD